MSMQRNDPPWPETLRQAANREELTSPRTQIVADREAYLGQGRHDVGRRISDEQVELFVGTDAATGLQTELARHQPQYIALHDVGTSASMRLLSSLAGAAGARVQRLSIRRQGHGVALAVIHFVEVPMADGQPVRVYSTDVPADAGTRQQLMRVLLGHSRLGVLLVGELGSGALASQLSPVQEALRRGPWPNRELLLVPLGSGSALAQMAGQLTHGTAVAAHVSPHAAKPKHVWTFIGGAWNRQQSPSESSRTLPTEMASAVPRPPVPSSEAITEPMPLNPAGAARSAEPAASATLPAMPAAVPMPVPGATPWQGYVDRCALIKGTVSACVFDIHSMQVLAQAGGPPSAERLAQQGAVLMATMSDASRALGLGPAHAEASISTTNHHLLLRPVPGHPGVALHLVLSASQANLVLTRMQLERISAPA